MKRERMVRMRERRVSPSHFHSIFSLAKSEYETPDVANFSTPDNSDFIAVGDRTIRIRHREDYLN